MTYTRRILKLHLLMARNRLWRTPGQAASSLGLLILMTGAMVGLTLGLRAGLSRLARPETGTLLLAGTVVGVSLLLFLESIRGVVPSFYRSPDTAYLMAAPIPPEEVAAAKLVCHILGVARGAPFSGCRSWRPRGWCPAPGSPTTC